MAKELIKDLKKVVNKAVFEAFEDDGGLIKTPTGFDVIKREYAHPAFVGDEHDLPLLFGVKGQ